MHISWNDGSGEYLTVTVNGDTIIVSTPENNTGFKRYKNITIKTTTTPPISKVLQISQNPIAFGDLTLNLSNVWNGNIEYKIENQMYIGSYRVGVNNVSTEKSVISGSNLQNWASFTGSKITFNVYGGGMLIGEFMLMGSDINTLKGGTGVEVTVFNF